MPCFLLIIALAFPRVVLALVFFFSTYLHRAYDSLLWPLVGFFFLPMTTLIYAWIMNSHGRLEGFYLVPLIVAVLFDLGLLGSSGKKARG